MNSIASVVQLVVYGLTLVVFVDVLLAFVLGPFHPARRALDAVVEPMLAPIRRIVPQAGGLDFSPAILISTAEGQLIALSGVCTHLTCTVRYDGDTGTLFCPCHNGRFDLSGNVLSGPPPRPLETFTVEVSGPDIIVSRKN